MYDVQYWFLHNRSAPARWASEATWGRGHLPPRDTNAAQIRINFSSRIFGVFALFATYCAHTRQEKGLGKIPRVSNDRSSCIYSVICVDCLILHSRDFHFRVQNRQFRSHSWNGQFRSHICRIFFKVYRLFRQYDKLREIQEHQWQSIVWRGRNEGVDSG